jgi:hypothetical protein
LQLEKFFKKRIKEIFMSKGIFVFFVLLCVSVNVFAANSGRIKTLTFLGVTCGDKFFDHSDKVQISIEGGITDGSGITRADPYAAVWAIDKDLVAALMMAYQNDWVVTIELHPAQTYTTFNRPRIVAVSFPSR